MATLPHRAGPVNGSRPRSRTAPTRAARPESAAPLPRLIAKTYGTPEATASADYPPGTPADPADATPAQHATALLAVLRALLTITSDFSDVDFALHFPTQLPDGGWEWSAGRNREYPFDQMLRLAAGTLTHPKED